MKLPAFQFYPGDWRKDPGVQALDFHDRGVWLEIICLMHESEDRGKLLLNGKPMPDDALARLLGLDKQILTTTLTTLLTYGVASRDEESGALICRRMVRDEYIRKIRSEAGKQGGNPALVKQSDKQNPPPPDKQIPTPSSSSSTSSSDNNPPNPPGGDGQGGPRVLPSGWEKLSISERKKRRVNRNSKLMLRIGGWFGRRDDTLWFLHEAITLKQVQPSEEEVGIVERYYTADTFEIRPTERDIDPRRKDLPTLLNNWGGEVDRARIWMAERGIE